MDWASSLRDQLRDRAGIWAPRPGVLRYESRGTPATVLFPQAAGGESHVNFFEGTWAAIRAKLAEA